MPRADSTEHVVSTTEALTSLDRLVHEPARLLILSQLYVVKKVDFLFVLRQTGLTQGNLSSHMRKLEAAGYVAVDKQFVDRKPRTLYALTRAGRAAFGKYVRSMKAVLGSLPG